MKKLILIVAALIVAFAVLLPFTSKTPDGLQTLTENSASQQQQPIWKGLMTEYSVVLADPYISALVAGLLGVGIVLTTGFVLGTTLAQKKGGSAGEQL